MAGNRIGICEWTLPVSGPYVFKVAKEAGYDGVQIRIGPWEKRFPLAQRVTQQAFLEEAARFGMEIPSIAARVTDWFSMFAPEGSEEHDIVVQGITVAIEAAGAMGVPTVLVPAFVRSEANTPAKVASLVKHLQWACDVAADSGVVIATENVFSVDATVQLFESVDRENLKLYFDLQNYYLHTGAHTPSLIEPLLPFFAEVHAKDGKNGDLSGAPLGEGDVSLRESIDELKRLGYDGWVVNENYYDVPPLVGPGDDPVALLVRDAQTLRTALA